MSTIRGEVHIKQFTRWLVKDRRASDDPLAHVAMLNVSIDRRHDRQSFALDADPATVTVLAACSKHRREDVLPLHPRLVVLLRPWLASKPAGQPVWPGNWATGKEAGAMLKYDLKAAGIPYVDESGRHADFHALRHTFIPNMVQAGGPPKAAQSLARHSTIDLTMNVYTSLTVHDQASALASLPPVPPLDRTEVGAAVLRATGMDGPEKVPTGVPSGAETGAVLPASPALRLAPDCTEAKEPRRTDALTPERGKTIRTKLHHAASGCTRGDARGPSRIRTGDGGFAIRCLTTWLRGRGERWSALWNRSPQRGERQSGTRRITALP